ncbi:hypothetical protein CPB84DRAFT_1966848 [Gymnopilus junonius]|uniref:F-box domain-containing protein n=1 Tax=Gymnopilus junonius TaxID=109634 RepID=A0A9P5TFP1_GYMJU|nr:hypothetical protein CPB84DRAFT_1966848 [Gymnopilus junonius]
MDTLPSDMKCGMSLDWSGEQFPSINDCSGSLGIIYRIPTEVLSTIFLFTTIPSSNDSDDLDIDLMSRTPVFSRKVKSTPFALSQVCRRWRDIVIDIKAMWRSIALLNPNEHQLYRLQLWMKRVRDHPLEVTIIFRYRRPPEPYQWHLFQMALEPLWENLGKWSTFYFDSPGYVPLVIRRKLRLLAHIESPVLRKAVIHINGHSEEVEELWTNLNCVQSLETLYFHSDHIYRASRQVNPRIKSFQFGQYREISRRMIFQESNPIVRILKPFPNVEELSIDTGLIRRSEDWEVEEGCPPVILQHLKSLKIVAWNSVSLFCRRFFTPCLSTLDITTNDLLDAKEIAHLLQCSGVNLMELVLRSPLAVDFLTEWIQSDMLKSISLISLHVPYDQLLVLEQLLQSLPDLQKRVSVYEAPYRHNLIL